MKNFFDELEVVLFTSSPEEKIEQFYHFYDEFCVDLLDFKYILPPKEHTNPTFANFCRIVKPENLPKRIKLDTNEGKARFVHAILHIEYCAIDLALDHTYRFRNLPREYYADWLEVAEDEIRHFRMLDSILTELGYSYGDFEVHQTLFDAQQSTQTLRSRMAVVPRYLEANGLDANIKMMQKLQGVGDKGSKTIIKALEIILQEEIDHVKKGDKWFLYACKNDEVDKSVYFDDVKAIMPNAWRQRNFVNKEARLLAGFENNEIERIRNGE